MYCNIIAKSTLVLVLLSLQLNLSSKVQAAVGLFGPDRYEGIPEACLLPMDFGHCRAKVKRYYYDMRRMKCSMFYWGGCAGNINNFKSLDECKRVCSDAYIEEVNDEQRPNNNAYNTVDRNRSNSKTKYSNNNNNNNNNDYKSVNGTLNNNNNATANNIYANADSVATNYNYKPSKYLLNSVNKKNYEVQKQEDSVDYDN